MLIWKAYYNIIIVNRYRVLRFPNRKQILIRDLEIEKHRSIELNGL